MIRYFLDWLREKSEDYNMDLPKEAFMPTVYAVYRAKVVENKDPEKTGRIKVFIPRLHLDCENKTKDGKFGIWAYPASSYWGDPEHGSLVVPPVDTYVYVFFEDGELNKARYFAGMHIKGNIPPECKRGSEWYKREMIIKMPSGKLIFISDDPDADCIVVGTPDSNVFTIWHGPGPVHISLIDQNDNFIEISPTDNIIKIKAAQGIQQKAGTQIFIQSGSQIVLKSPNVLVDGNLSVSGTFVTSAVGGSPPCPVCVAPVSGTGPINPEPKRPNI